MCLICHILVNRKTTVPISFIKTFPISTTHFFYTQNLRCPDAANSRSHSQILYPHMFLVPTRYITNVSNHQTPSHRYDIIASNKLITNYIRSGDLGSAIQVFESMPFKNTVTWNSILAGYARKSGEVLDARKVFDRIPEPDYFSCNTMLACYVNNSDMEAAWIFFDEMHVRDIASWNTMISGFSRNGMMSEAYQFFSVMPERNDVTWNAMVSGYAQSGDMESAVKMFEIAPVKSVVGWTAVVSGYLKLGKVELAEQVFSEMPVKNVVTWNSMIAGYVENHRSEDALKLFRQMMESGITPNSSSMSSVLLGCSELSALKLGKQVHQFLCRSPLHSDTTIGTSLISMYCKCGELEDALKLFHEIPKKDVVTWNAMISGYAQYGQGEKALSLFDKMQNHGLKPNWITFVGLLSACNHAGLVDIGLHLFYTMQKNYGIAAKPDHYTCVVDLLGRAGKLDEAVDLVKRMPFIPHPAIYGIILGACRIHKNLEAAEFAAKNLLDCDPVSSTAYIQLANVYAAMNKWDHVLKIRRSMKKNNVIKIPGYTWIEVNNTVHKFRSGDRLHPELTVIHEKLNELEKKMKAAGYLPNFEFALHNLDKEQKKQMLLWHSEKLAIAYGLIKSPVGVPVRLFKNLRVCGDCHEATKFISRIEIREIIVRDTTRFHHFKNGVCSCGDYW